jgi:hypothetical protein
VASASAPSKTCCRASCARLAALFALGFLFLTALPARPSASVAASVSPKKAIIDTDPGTDDAIAILLALNSPEVHVRAITVAPGNVTVQQGLENALNLVSLANGSDIPVAGGAEHPLFQKLATAEFWHGKNGLANVGRPASRCKADAPFAADLIIQMIHEARHENTLVPIGPVTMVGLEVGNVTLFTRWHLGELAKMHDA